MDDPTTEQHPEGHDILAIVLDKPTRANEVLLALSHLQGEGKVRMHDAVIVSKDADGRASVVETVDLDHHDLPDPEAKAINYLADKVRELERELHQLRQEVRRARHEMR